jgi:5-methylcytosine-specific restriction endonuclease McrA
MCENCGIHPGKEVHHLYHQMDANSNGIIVNEDIVLHKNNLANLMTLCENCHNNMHNNFKKGGRRVKTSKGVKIQQTK